MREDAARGTIVAAAAVAVFATFAPPCDAAQERSVTIDEVDTIVWTPDRDSGMPLPVVVFSHGLYTCATQSRYLTRAIADAGYLVIAPNHSDASCVLRVDWGWFSRMAAKPPQAWTDDDYRDRADDVRKLVAALGREAKLRGKADRTRLALMGHSLGGYTVLGLAGAWPSWTIPNVKAVLALAPYSLPFERSDGLRHLRAPVMYQAGGLDPVFTPPLRHAFESSPEPKYYVEMEHAWHLAWSDIGAMYKDRIVAYAIAFLDHHVKNAPESTSLHDAHMRGALSGDLAAR